MTEADRKQIEAAKADAELLWNIYNATGGAILFTENDGTKHDIGEMAHTLTRRVIELEDWRARALPWLKKDLERQKFTDYNDGENKTYFDRDIAILTALIAEVKE